jgi:hypothetical protein
VQAREQAVRRRRQAVLLDHACGPSQVLLYLRTCRMMKRVLGAQAISGSRSAGRVPFQHVRCPNAHMQPERCCSVRSAGLDGSGSGSEHSGRKHSGSGAPDLQAQHEVLLARLRATPPEQLPALVEAEREAITTAFLGWLSDLARGGSGVPGWRPPPSSSSSSSGGGGGGGGSAGDGAGTRPSATAAERAALSQLVAHLTQLKEAADWEAARRLLPPLASSLAYNNYAAWRQQTGEELADVAPGVSLEDIYKAGEREVCCGLRGRVVDRRLISIVSPP